MRFDWAEVQAKLVKHAAPVAATALGSLGGPIGAAASVMIGKALGVDPTPQAISRAIDTDPAALTKIAEAEARIAEAMAGDLRNARETFKSSPMPAIVFAVTSLMVVSLFGAAYFLAVQPQTAGTAQAWDFLKTQGAQIFIVWVGAAGYFVSSSLGSRNKEAAMERKMS